MTHAMSQSGAFACSTRRVARSLVWNSVLTPRTRPGQPPSARKSDDRAQNLAWDASALRVAKVLKHTSHFHGQGTSTAMRLFLAHALCLLVFLFHNRKIRSHTLGGTSSKAPTLSPPVSGGKAWQPMSVAKHASHRKQTQRLLQRNWCEPHAHKCPGRPRSALRAPPHPNAIAPLTTAPDADPLTFARSASYEHSTPPPRPPWHPAEWTDCPRDLRMAVVAWEHATAFAFNSFACDTQIDVFLTKCLYSVTLRSVSPSRSGKRGCCCVFVLGWISHPLASFAVPNASKGSLPFCRANVEHKLDVSGKSNYYSGQNEYLLNSEE